MEANELRIGNITKQGIVKSFYEHGIHVGLGKTFKFSELEPIQLTEEWLERLCFTPIENSMYVNGKQWILQINGYVDEDNPELPNKDGAWFDGIGTHSFKRDGAMAVNVLCRGNYVCTGPTYVHDVQNLFFSMEGFEMIVK